MSLYKYVHGTTCLRRRVRGVSARGRRSVNLSVCVCECVYVCVPVVRREWCTQSQTTTLKQAVLRAHSVDPPTLPPRPGWRPGDASVTAVRGGGQAGLAGAGAAGGRARSLCPAGPAGPSEALWTRGAGGRGPHPWGGEGRGACDSGRLSCCGRGQQVLAGRPGVRPGAGPPGGE